MKIHFCGIGGIAMGNLAAMLKEIGHDVSGSDAKLYPPMSEMLKKWKIPVKEYSAKNIGKADLYIIGNAISRPHPEAEEILNRNLNYTSMPEALARFFLRGKEVIVVSGTHGKTTTSFLTDHLLTKIDGPPGFFAGGIRNDGMQGFRVSKSKYFVIEGDEYDSAFFDKASKFLHYRPYYLILTSVEFDHADIFQNIGEYRKSFERLLRTVPSKGAVIAAKTGKEIDRLLENYTLSPTIRYSDLDTRFEFLNDEKLFPLIGRHNKMNGAAVASLALRLGFSLEQIKTAFSDFPGIRRRQQVRLNKIDPEKPGFAVTFIEDFAHHPSAVKETILAVKKAYPGRVIHALFEPRSASSHRNIFQNQYMRALATADRIYICEVFNKTKVSEDLLLNVRQLADDIQKTKNATPTKTKGTGKKKTLETVHYGKDTNAILATFKKTFRPSPKGDVILAMSNGAFGGIYPELDLFLSSVKSPPS